MILLCPGHTVLCGHIGGEVGGRVSDVIKQIQDITLTCDTHRRTTDSWLVGDTVKCCGRKSTCREQGDER